MDSTTLLEVRDLSCRFSLGRGRFLSAVDRVSFSIAANEVLGLVGESASGKSTLGRAIVGLLPKHEGAVFYRGEALPKVYGRSDYRLRASQMQMIFQHASAALNPRMTVFEIIAEGLVLAGGYSKRDIRKQTLAWMARVGLVAEHLSRYPHEFSGGQRQRIGIARAMIMSPEFVVCDELTSALDVSVQAQVLNMIRSLREEIGLSLLFIAHDLAMVRYISDRIAVMYRGRIMEIGSAQAVCTDPMHPYTRLLIASFPEPDPKNRNLLAARAVPEVQQTTSSGCPFADRCPQVMADCHHQTPELVEQADPAGAGAVRWVACHLYNSCDDLATPVSGGPP